MTATVREGTAVQFDDTQILGGEIGIDTLRIGGPSRRLFRRATGWKAQGSISEDGEFVGTAFLRVLPETGARLQVIAGQDHEYAFCEFSAPKVMGSDNVRPLDLEEARKAWGKVAEEADEFVTWPDEVNVNRLDVARDFTDVPELGPLLLGLSSVPVPGRKVRDLYRDPAAGNAQTLFVRNKSGGCRLYDKGEESGLPGTAGRLRCEAQERRAGLRAKGVATFRSLTNADVYRIGRERFDWAGFGRSVATIDVAGRRVLRSTDLTDGQRLQALGALTASRLGEWDAIGNRYRRARLRRILEDCGAFCCDELAGVVRLDFERGVIREAA